jgi:predicted transcriptional regulator
LKGQGQKQFSNKEIRTALKENQSNQKRWMLELKNCGYIRKAEGDQKKGFLYEVSSYEEYEELQGRIAAVLDEILEQLKAVQQSGVVQSKNEPLNKLVASKKKAKEQAVSQNEDTA